MATAINIKKTKYLSLDIDNGFIRHQLQSGFAKLKNYNLPIHPGTSPKYGHVSI